MSEPASQPEDAATDPYTVVDVPDAGRWEVREGDRIVGIAQYQVVPGADGHPDRVVFFHTEVRPSVEGHGLASRLARAALDATIASGRDIVALCPYIRTWVGRHQDPYAAHVVPATQADVDAVEQDA
jgi:predicted GNAT family acetyltransferase